MEIIKEKFDVEIVGISLTLKSVHNEEMVKELACYVDKKIKEALPLTKNNSIQIASLLASLNIAEELFLLKEEAVEKLDFLEKRVNDLLSKLESSHVSRLSEMNTQG